MKHKCEYCGKPAYNSNCHAHQQWCPLYCKEEKPKPQGSLPLGNGLELYFLIIIYINGNQYFVNDDNDQVMNFYFKD